MGTVRYPECVQDWKIERTIAHWCALGGSFERVGRTSVARVGALAALALAVVMLSACSGCKDFNLFGSKDDQPPDEPADKLYNQGVFLLNEEKNYKEAAKKFEEVDRQHPYSEWARKALIMSAYAYYEARAYDDFDHRGAPLYQPASRQRRSALCAVPDRLVLFRPDPRRDRAIRAAPNAPSPRSTKWCANIPTPNMR